MQAFASHGAITFYLPLGAAPEAAPLHLVWAHGWGEDHHALLGLARGLERQAAHSLLDLPGFGRSPPPPKSWGTADYAEAVSGWLDTLPRRRRIWIGHSFGCRVGIRLAARRPDLVDGMFLIAAAGLPRARSLPQQLKLALKVRLFKALNRLGRVGIDTTALKHRLGSADYRNAGPLRPILVRAVSEDLTETARLVRCPVKLLYGARDTETPPEMGRRFAALMADAEFGELPRLDHISILSAGSHQLHHQLQQFIGRFS